MLLFIKKKICRRLSCCSWATLGNRGGLSKVAREGHERSTAFARNRIYERDDTAFKFILLRDVNFASS